ncbi:FtsK/SpoIIIE domain-containing protein [Nonomuraea sp. NPDC050394]|uniref:FtsK/SpoIIIE domain-containing protein n=1 Tax=Nonomuraea sp. NPDC050394 TaxID=3364363 RepID=UPI00378EDCD1
MHWRPTAIKTPAAFVLAIWLWRLVAGLVKTVWRHPVACALVVVLGGYAWLVGWRGALVWYGSITVWLGVFVLLHRRGFMFLVGWPFVSWWRWLWVYRRRWHGTLMVAGLAGRVGGRSFVPDLVKVRADRWADTVTVRMLRGQSPELWAQRTVNLAHAFGSVACLVRVKRPGWLLLVLQRGDRLAAVIAARPIPLTVGVGPVEIGIDEHGRVYRLAVHGTHVLIVGATGSGKGSWLWGIVRGLLPGTAAGLVELWGVDAKGMELGFAEGLFRRYALRGEAAVELLELAVARMQKRAERYRGVTRRHVPTTDEPFVLVIIDEVAFLTAYEPDRDLRRRALAALATLTSQGRAVGFGVVAALQDPRKEVLDIRHLFPDKIVLRVEEADQVDLALGKGARERGARADEIPYNPDDRSVGSGTGYVRLEGNPEPLRVRAGWVGDGDLKEMEAEYGRAVEALDQPTETKVINPGPAVTTPPLSWGNGDEGDGCEVEERGRAGGKRRRVNGSERPGGKRGKRGKGGRRPKDGDKGGEW